MTLNAEIKTFQSKKTGNDYEALVIELAPGVEKLVFLSSAEMALLKLNK